LPYGKVSVVPIIIYAFFHRHNDPPYVQVYILKLILTCTILY